MGRCQKYHALCFIKKMNFSFSYSFLATIAPGMRQWFAAGLAAWLISVPLSGHAEPWAITHLGGYKGKWIAVATRDSEYAEQVYSGFQEMWPSEWISEQSAKGFHITALSGDKKGWGVVMSRRRDGKNPQQIVLGPRPVNEELDAEIEGGREKGFGITTVGGFLNEWVIVMDKAPDGDDGSHKLQVTLKPGAKSVEEILEWWARQKAKDPRLVITTMNGGFSKNVETDERGTSFFLVATPLFDALPPQALEIAPEFSKVDTNNAEHPVRQIAGYNNLLVLRGGSHLDGTRQRMETSSDFAALVAAILAADAEGAMPAIQNPDGMKMLWVKPGSIDIKDYDASHGEHFRTIRIPEGFYLGETEVTQKQWENVMGSNPSLHQGEDLPVENVNWLDIQERFCGLLTQRDHENGSLPKWLEYWLPTKDMWEYACRAGFTGHAFDEEFVKDMAWCKENSGGQTHPVAGKKPNPWGFYDMLGNVRELCADNIGPTPGHFPERGGDYNLPVIPPGEIFSHIHSLGSVPSGSLGFRLATRPRAEIVETMLAPGNSSD